MTLHYENTPIHFETYGKGPAIILLHGFLESSSMWNPLITQFSEHNFVITLDFPGHGRSGVISENHSMELMSEVIDNLLVHLEIPSATFVGHSMGGYVTMAYAEMFPEKIDKLILLNSTPAADSKERKQDRNRALKLIDRNSSAFISMAITNLFAATSREKFSTAINTLKQDANSFPLEGIKAAIRGMRDRKDRREVLKNFNKEKYSILSEEDPLLAFVETRELAESCGSRVITIAGGHHSTYENLYSVSKNLKLILES